MQRQVESLSSRPAGSPNEFCSYATLRSLARAKRETGVDCESGKLALRWNTPGRAKQWLKIDHENSPALPHRIFHQIIAPVEIDDFDKCPRLESFRQNVTAPAMLDLDNYSSLKPYRVFAIILAGYSRAMDNGCPACAATRLKRERGGYGLRTVEDLSRLVHRCDFRKLEARPQLQGSTLTR